MAAAAVGSPGFLHDEHMTIPRDDPPLTAREQAVISLLRLIEDHLYILVRITQRYGEPDDKWDGTPSPVDPYDGGPRDPLDVLLGLGAFNRRRWRVVAVEYALYALADCPDPFGSDFDPGVAYARAVYHEYVQPFAEYDPRGRAYSARKGVRWMAARLPGEILACEEMMLSPRLGMDRRADLIWQMRCDLKDDGKPPTYDEIRTALRCSKGEVRDVCIARGGRRRRKSTAVSS